MTKMNEYRPKMAYKDSKYADFLRENFFFIYSIPREMGKSISNAVKTTDNKIGAKKWCQKLCRFNQ